MAPAARETRSSASVSSHQRAWWSRAAGIVKNVAGYDFPKLLTGSMGTLGIITQVTLKVRPIPEASAIAWIPFHQASTIAEALDRLNTSGTRPIAIDLLNSEAGLLVGRVLSVPTAAWVLVIGFDDNADSVRWQIGRLKDELAQGDMVVIEHDRAATMWESLTEFQALKLGPISFVANLRPSQVVSFVDQLGEALVDPGERRQRDRAGPRARRLDHRSGCDGDRHSSSSGTRGRWRIGSFALPDGVERTPRRVGIRPAGLDDGRAGQAGSRPARRHEPRPVCWYNMRVGNGDGHGLERSDAT